MDKKIMIIKAMGNKPIEVEIKDNSGVTHKGYIYNVNTNTCVITTEYDTYDDELKASVDECFDCI